MKINPKVSIITIYHNRQDHVVDSVKSLLEQTYDNLDIIIVDDNSTDDTFERIKNTVNNSPRVNLIQNQENKGFTQTLIDIIRTLDTAYIAIHGAGDISLPTRVEEQVNYMLAKPLVGVVTVDITNIKNPKFHKTQITLEDLLKKNRITHGAVMFKKEVYNQVGGYRKFFTTRQDKDLWFRMSFYTQIHFFKRKLYTLTEIKSTITKSASKSGMPTFLSAFAEYLVRERINIGTDSLDEIGSKSALYFNPNKASKLFRRNLIWNLVKGNRNEASNWLNLLKKTSTSNFSLLMYKGIGQLLK